MTVSRRWIAEVAEPAAHAGGRVRRSGRAAASARARAGLPGVLAGITQALGAERINIEDFELQHYSPDRGGVLTIPRRREEPARRAADLLEAGKPGSSSRPCSTRDRQVEPARALIGHVAVPGDKSISHRAVLLGALADGPVEITGFGRAGDTESTVRAIRALGIDVEEPDVDRSQPSAACAG